MLCSETHQFGIFIKVIFFMNLELFDLFHKPENPHPFCIPYMGSKRGIAERLLDEMLKIKPNAKYFYDLFGGGGAMSFMAAQYGLNVVYNEKNSAVSRFLEFIFDRIKTGKKSKFGIFPEEWYEFVGREQFFSAIAKNDAFSQFCRTCYSFGNKGTSYSFNKHIEEYCKQKHNYVLHKDQQAKKIIKERFDGDYSRFLDHVETGKDWVERRGLFSKIFLKIEALRVANLYQKDFSDFFSDFTPKQFYDYRQVDLIGLINEKIPHIDKKKYKSGSDSLESLKKLQRLQQLEHLQQLEQLEQLEQLQRLEQLEQLEQLQRLEQLERFNSFFSIQNKDFLDVEITTPIDQTIVYLDPPYRGTAKYELDVDHDALDSYFRNSQFTCFMSEYNAPHKEVFSLEKRSLLNSSKVDNVIERLYFNGVL